MSNPFNARANELLEMAYRPTGVDANLPSKADRSLLRALEGALLVKLFGGSSYRITRRGERMRGRVTLSESARLTGA